MRELKSQIALLQGLSYVEYREVYLKSEADKVIAEKDKQLRRYKYKRCLDMAKWCYDRWIREYNSSRLQKSRFYAEWQKRWEKLAEKFKEGR